MSIVISKSNLICKNKINRHKQLEYSKFQIYWKKKEISYFELLDRLSYLLKVYNNNPSVNQKLIICPPKIKRDGPKKTIFINFGITCKKLNRTKGHLFSYITGELGTSASIQDGGGLVLKGRYLSKGIENVLRNYIRNMCYVIHVKVLVQNYKKISFLNFFLYIAQGVLLLDQ